MMRMRHDRRPRKMASPRCELFCGDPNSFSEAEIQLEWLCSLRNVHDHAAFQLHIDMPAGLGSYNKELDSLRPTAASTQSSAAAEVSSMLRFFFVCHSASTLQPPDMSAEAGYRLHGQFKRVRGVGSDINR